MLDLYWAYYGPGGGSYGLVDITDFSHRQIYEIKPLAELLDGIKQVHRYMQYISPLPTWPRAPFGYPGNTWTFGTAFVTQFIADIGPWPGYADWDVKAFHATDGVILYYGVPTGLNPIPVPVRQPVRATQPTRPQLSPVPGIAAVAVSNALNSWQFPAIPGWLPWVVIGSFIVVGGAILCFAGGCAAAAAVIGSGLAALGAGEGLGAAYSSFILPFLLFFGKKTLCWF